MRTILCVILLTIPFAGLTQAEADSLKDLMLLKKDMKETERIDILNALSYTTRATNAGMSMAYAQEALKASKEIRYKKGEGMALLMMGDHYLVRSELDKSLICGLTSLEIFEAEKDEKGLMGSCYVLAFTHAYLNNENKFQVYHKRALMLAKKLGDNEMLARLYYAEGYYATARTKNQEASLPFYKEALHFVEKNDRANIKVFLLGSIASVYLTNGDQAKAMELLTEGLRISTLQHNKRGEALICLFLSGAYTVRGEFDTVEQYLIRGQKLARECGAKKMLLDSYIGFIGLKQHTGKPAEAHEYQKKYAQVRDSIFNTERVQQIAELEIKHETEQKEQTIILLEHEKKIQRIWRNVLVVGILMMGLIAFLIYRLQRSRTQKAHQLLDVQHVLNDKLKELDKIKTKFFANISHEFRTPLTLILAPLEGILKNNSISEERDVLHMIKRNAYRLLELINQLLDLSKLEAGKMGLRIEHGDADHFFKMLASSFESLAEYNRCNFKQHINIPEKDHWFDRDKLEKITMNLLSNAFKVTKAGGTITMTVTVEKGSEGLLTLCVEDEGPGISSEDQEYIFSPFYQIKGAKENINQGSGLGLSLTKELVKLYRGTIDLVSTPGSGTVFKVMIPIHQTSFLPDEFEEMTPHPYVMPDPMAYMEVAMREHQPEPESEGRDSILIVEDNADLLVYMQTILKSEFSVLTARDGAEALALAVKQIPSLILSDLMMPTMDGIALTREIKTDVRTSHIPVILLTARNETQSRMDGLKTGADDYLTKPFSSDELLVRIQNLILQRKKLAEVFREQVLVLPTPATENSLDDKFLIRAREVVEAHLSDFTFTVEMMADELFLSRTQMLRKLKALTGLTPSDFIRDLRLKHAAEKIRQKSDTITRIGYAVGFSDQSYFSKCFKKQYGVTPTEYK